MFAQLTGLTTTELGSVVSSFVAIPVVIPLALTSVGVGIVVIGARAIQKLLGRRR